MSNSHAYSGVADVAGIINVALETFPPFPTKYDEAYLLCRLCEATRLLHTFFEENQMYLEQSHEWEFYKELVENFPKEIDNTLGTSSHPPILPTYSKATTIMTDIMLTEKKDSNNKVVGVEANLQKIQNFLEHFMSNKIAGNPPSSS